MIGDVPPGEWGSFLERLAVSTSHGSRLFTSSMPKALYGGLLRSR
jgi:hypothetical protein